jgi:broad specificity phosphatase PhoE
LLDTIANRFAGKRVLAVSHGALIRQVLGIVSDGAVPPAGERISNACLNTFICEPESGWQLLEYAPQPLG